MASKGKGLRLVAQPIDEDRRCAQCGDFVDPIDWCPGCRGGTPCGSPHKSVRKRVDAKFCDDACRSLYRSSFIRDCL